MQSIPNTIRVIASYLFLFFTVLYLLTASISNFYHGDASQLRIEVVKSIVERYDVSIPAGLTGADGREYSWVGIGSVLPAIPFYITGKLIGLPYNAVSVMNQLFGAATVALIFIFLIFLGYSKRASVLTATMYGMGTFAWPLAKQQFDHVVETFFAVLSVYLLCLYLQNKKVSNLVFSAFSLGMAVLTRLTSLLIIPALFVLIVMHRSRKSNINDFLKKMSRDTILFSLSFLPFIIFQLWYNYYRFGSIYESGYSLMAYRLGVDFFSGTPLLTGLKGFLISPGKGFFYYSPVAILSIFTIKSFIKNHRELSLCFIIIILSHVVFLSKNMFWHGDWAWGPRYILVITPFLIIPIVQIFDSAKWNKNNLTKLAISTILIVSIMIQLAAVSVSFFKYFLNLRYEEKIEFTVAQGEGMQSIVGPPSETYFEWSRSPILAQFKFIYEVSGGIKHYKYKYISEDATPAEKRRFGLHTNVFDFWWIYIYFLTGTYSGFVVAILLLISASYFWVRIWIASRSDL